MSKRSCEGLCDCPDCAVSQNHRKKARTGEAPVYYDRTYSLICRNQFTPCGPLKSIYIDDKYYQKYHLLKIYHGDDSDFLDKNMLSMVKTKNDQMRAKFEKAMNKINLTEEAKSVNIHGVTYQIYIFDLFDRKTSCKHLLEMMGINDNDGNDLNDSFCEYVLPHFKLLCHQQGWDQEDMDYIQLCDDYVYFLSWTRHGWFYEHDNVSWWRQPRKFQRGEEFSQYLKEQMTKIPAFQHSGIRSLEFT